MQGAEGRRGTRLILRLCLAVYTSNWGMGVLCYMGVLCHMDVLLCHMDVLCHMGVLCHMDVLCHTQQRFLRALAQK